jgi:hypothetical protein
MLLLLLKSSCIIGLFDICSFELYQLKIVCIVTQRVQAKHIRLLGFVWHSKCWIENNYPTIIWYKEGFGSHVIGCNATPSYSSEIVAKYRMWFLWKVTCEWRVWNSYRVWRWPWASEFSQKHDNLNKIIHIKILTIFIGTTKIQGASQRQQGELPRRFFKSAPAMREVDWEIATRRVATQNINLWRSASWF